MRIQLTGKTCLHLDEVEVYETNFYTETNRSVETDLATQSSTCEHSTRSVPAHNSGPPLLPNTRKPVGYATATHVQRGTIRKLRLVGIPVKTHPVMHNPPMGLTHDDPGKFVMGTVPVEEDGSAYFEVPSGVNFFVQALDAQGKAVQTMRSATYVQPGQTFTCVGCHEPRNTTPPDVFPVASKREPSKISPGPEGSWPLDYQVLVQPVLERRCVACHGPGAECETFDLSAQKSYEALVNYGEPSLRTQVVTRFRQSRSTAGGCVAAASPLLRLLEEGHYEVDLSADENDRLITWMDTYGQLLGSFSKEQEQRLVELRGRMASILDHDIGPSEQGPEKSAATR